MTAPSSPRRRRSESNSVEARMFGSRAHLLGVSLEELRERGDPVRGRRPRARQGAVAKASVIPRVPVTARIQASLSPRVAYRRRRTAAEAVAVVARRASGAFVASCLREQGGDLDQRDLLARRAFHELLFEDVFREERRPGLCGLCSERRLCLVELVEHGRADRPGRPRAGAQQRVAVRVERGDGDLGVASPRPPGADLVGVGASLLCLSTIRRFVLQCGAHWLLRWRSASSVRI